MPFKLIVVASAICLLLAGCGHSDYAGNAPLSEEEAIIAMAMAHHESYEEDAPARDETAAASLPPVTLGPLAEPISYKDAVAQPALPMRYTLDTGDRIRVFIYGQPNLSRLYTVDGGGFISIPLINAVKARGLTTFELERRIAHALSRDLVRDPEVSIEVTAYRPFYILGEVRTAGQYPFRFGLTARRAVAIAGGFTPRARKETVTLTRELGDVKETLAIDLDETVMPGDVITIEERWF